MKNWIRIIPYISLSLATLVIYILLKLTYDSKIESILTGILSNSLFFFIAYLFYDIIKEIIIKNEQKSISEYIKNRIASDILVALYNLKKIIHGYNLDTNNFENIIKIAEYTKEEIKNSLINQNYLGFQIYKNSEELRNLFQTALTDNFILKYSSHFDSINLLKISNNLNHIESYLKSDVNFYESAERGIEYKVSNAKEFNIENDNKFILLKKTNKSDQFVVYDSGFFDTESENKLLKRYTLKPENAEKIAFLLYDTFFRMRNYILSDFNFKRKDTRFRIIKNFFSLDTRIKTKNQKVFVADIIEKKKQ